MVVILAISTIAGLGLGLLRGGSLRRLAELPVHLGWLALLCLLLQLYVVYAPEGPAASEHAFRAALLMASYGALLVVVWANRRTVGLPIIGLGILLNFVVMAANGGYMPISRDAILAAGTRTSESIPEEGTRIPRTKDVLLSAERTRLGFLSDVIVFPPLPVAKVYSIGDLLVGLGIFALFQGATLPAGDRRKQREERGANAA